MVRTRLSTSFLTLLMAFTTVDWMMYSPWGDVAMRCLIMPERACIDAEGSEVKGGCETCRVRKPLREW